MRVVGFYGVRGVVWYGVGMWVVMVGKGYWSVVVGRLEGGEIVWVVVGVGWYVVVGVGGFLY